VKPAPIKVKRGGKAANVPPPRPRIWDRVRTKESAAVAGIVALTALVYLRCLGNGYVFDDHEMILVNRYIGEWSFLWKALVNDSWWFRDPAHLPQSHYYRPLQDIWLGLNYQVFGLNPVGPHALMVGLHLVAVVFAYRIATRLAADRIAGVVAALLFGLLPVHAEAVIWATAIPESLAGTLQLGAFDFYLRYREGNFSRGLTWSMTLFAGALLSHESAIGFPLLVAVHGFLFAKNGDRLDGKAVSARAPLKDASHPHPDPHPNPLPGQGEVISQRIRGAVAIAVPFIILAIVYLGARFAVLGFITKRDVNNHATLAQIVLTLPTVVVHNLADIINPWQAGPSHRITWVDSPWSADFWMPAVGLGLIGAAGLIALADSPKRKVYLFSVAWVFIAMAPVLNLGILYPNALVADRYLYFSSFGYCLMAGQAVAAIGRANLTPTRPLAATVGLVAAVYGLTLWQVQHFWHDEIALFGRCIERFPESGFCHNRLGMALQSAGDMKGAEQELTTAFKLDPADYAAEYDLAMVHARQSHYAQAARESADALKHLANAPPSAYITVAELYDAADDHQASEAMFAQAEKLPGAAYEVALARARISLGRKDGAGAERQLKTLLALSPDEPSALLMLGSALGVQQRYEEALAVYEHALRVVPSNQTVRFLIALTRHNLGRNREALVQCQLVLQAAPSNPNARALIQAIERDMRASAGETPRP
jgi:tetratricopeptide (TPR) repeat protein